MNCSYGCGEKARYQLKNGKWCCSTFSTKCPAVRKKNVRGLKKAHIEGRLSAKDLDGYRGWAKGLTKESNKSLQIMASKISDIQKRQAKEQGDEYKLTKWNKNRPKESLIRQGKTTRLAYQRGDRTPPLSGFRGKYSYFIYNGRKWLLRSRDEFVFALFLAVNGCEFDYESVRVKFKGRTKISDFEVSEKIYEVKGKKTKKDEEIRKAFETAGYPIRFVYWWTTNALKRYLKKRGFDIEFWYDEIKRKCDDRDPVVFDYARMEKLVNSHG